MPTFGDGAIFSRRTGDYEIFWGRDGLDRHRCLLREESVEGGRP